MGSPRLAVKLSEEAHQISASQQYNNNHINQCGEPRWLPLGSPQHPPSQESELGRRDYEKDDIWSPNIEITSLSVKDSRPIVAR